MPATPAISRAEQPPDPEGVTPRIAAIIRMLASRGDDPRPVAELGPAAARARLRRLWADFWSAGGPQVAVKRDLSIETGLGPIRVRLYDPDSDGTAPILFFHGGGFVIGDLDTHDGVPRRIALYSGRPVISVDYRLAPEHPYPAPLDDCVAAASAIAQGALAGIDGSRFAVMGDSAGANLALAACLRLRDEKQPAPTAAVLFFGCYDPAMSRPSYASYGDGRYLLSNADISWYWRQYLGDRMASPPVYAGLLSAELAGLPPLYLTACECDPLRDDSTALAERLEAAGVEHELHLWQGMVHGCIGMSRELQQADAFLADAAVWLARKLRAEGG
jgi:acetyl esterase